MANLNKVFLIGKLTRDPDLRHTPQGTAVAELGLAVNRVWRDPGGEKREETCFVDISAWGTQAQTIHKYLRKGSPIFVEGRLHFSSWETKEGEKRSKLRVRMESFQFLDSQSSRQGFENAASPRAATSGARTAAAAPANATWSNYPAEPPIDDDLDVPPAGGPDEDVPF
ncbi:MAG: single-stranded DNA-binding protein [Planctomycetes bacterium]|nr:single-stranded DNA-binding protein [Planctomycetota bacterium]